MCFVNLTNLVAESLTPAFNFLSSQPLLLDSLPKLYINTYIVVSLLLLGIVSWYVNAKQKEGLQSRGSDGKEIPLLHCWLPCVGHGFRLIWRPYSFLQSACRECQSSIVRLKAFGVDILIINNDEKANAKVSQASSSVEYDSLSWAFLSRAFRLDDNCKQSFFDIQGALASLSASSPEYTETPSLCLNAFIALFEQNAPFLITFSSSLVDQLPWERATGLEVSSDSYSPLSSSDNSVKASFPALIKNFTGHVLLKGLLGSDLMELYPGICSDLNDLELNYKWMLLGVPRWVPIPGLLAAHIARRRLELGLSGFHQALDRASIGIALGSGWTEVSDVNIMMVRRSKLYRERSVREEVRLALDIDLLMALYTQISALTTWLVLRISLDQELLQDVYSETAQFAKATQADQIFSIPSPPRLKLDMHGLRTTCPLLEACLMETLRIDTFQISISKMMQGLSLGSRKPGSISSVPPVSRLLLKDKVYITVTDVLSSSDAFQPRSRSMQELNEARAKTPNTHRPWSRPRVDSHRPDFVHDLAMAFAIGLLALWRFDFPPKTGTLLPSPPEFPAIFRQLSDVQIQVSRRTF